MLSWLVIVPILIAVILYIMPYARAGRIIAAISQTILTFFAFYAFLQCKENNIISYVGNFQNNLGITLKMDTFSSVFIMLTTIIFLFATIYNFYEDFNKLFWFLMFIWESLLIGVFLSNDFFNIFVLVEVATVIVSVLIMFKRDNRSMNDGMLYLMVNTVVIQFYLFGIGYIYKITGVLDIDLATKVLSSLDKTSLALPYALIITAITLKCALIPLFSWLPKAHGTPGAPTVVSAVLSGLHIKSSIYLFIRIQNIFVGIDTSNLFLIIGIITGVLGFILAISQTDIKLILAYHTISQIGMIMIGLNLNNKYSYTGSVYHIVNHALFKSALFLSAGIIIQAYGTRDIYKIKGVLKKMPVVGVATIMAIMGIIGAPFFSGSISKYFIMAGTNGVVNSFILFINLGTIISFIKYSTMLLGDPPLDEHTIKIDLGKKLAVTVLGILCFAGGVFGEQIIYFLFNVNMHVDSIGYLQKIALFVLSVIIGFFVFKYYIKKSVLFKHIREIELNFRGICISIGAFFALVLVYVLKLS